MSRQKLLISEKKHPVEIIVEFDILIYSTIQKKCNTNLANIFPGSVIARLLYYDGEVLHYSRFFWDVANFTNFANKIRL